MPSRHNSANAGTRTAKREILSNECRSAISDSVNELWHKGEAYATVLFKQEPVTLEYALIMPRFIPKAPGTKKRPNHHNSQSMFHTTAKLNILLNTGYRRLNNPLEKHQRC